MLLGTLVARVLGNMSTNKGIVEAGKRTITFGQNF